MISSATPKGGNDVLVVRDIHAFRRTLIKRSFGGFGAFHPHVMMLGGARMLIMDIYTVKGFKMNLHGPGDSTDAGYMLGKGLPFEGASSASAQISSKEAAAGRPAG